MQQIKLSQRLLTLVCLLASILMISSRVSAAEKRPNIVLIVSDDQGWRGVSYHSDLVKTPNIEKLCRDGVELDRFYVSPMCSPTRAGLMTGRYPMRFGMARSVVRPWAKFGLPPEETTMPEALAPLGYEARGAFGKWHLGHLSPEWHPISQGFTTFTGLYNGAADYFTRSRNGETDWHHDADDSDEPGYTTTMIGDAACKFIADNAKKESPFFCYVPFSAPHDPLQAPQKYVDAYKQYADADGKPTDKQMLAATTAAMDENVGRIVKAIDDAGIANDTIVWFLSDNGGAGPTGHDNSPLRGHKLEVYEGGVRVPAAVHWPGKIEGGRKIEAPIVNVDILPTLVSLVGGTPKTAKPLDGVDVSSVLLGKSDDLPPRDLYYFTGQDGMEKEQIAVTDGEGWKLIVIGPDVRREGGIKSDGHEVQLFDLKNDPYEKSDLSAQHPDIVDKLAAKAIAFRASESEKSLPPINKPPQGFSPPKGWHNDYVKSAVK